jgi:negative regulator of flagellin synthesis FlgM
MWRGERLTQITSPFPRPFRHDIRRYATGPDFIPGATSDTDQRKDPRMNVSGSYRVNGPHALQGPHSPRPTAPASSPQAMRGADQVDISAAAQAASETQSTDFRADLVARIKGEINAGVYETAAKLDAAVDRLLDEVG